ncbi:hypothetical protein ACWEOO_02740 [Kribbella sp. NPDC004138]
MAADARAVTWRRGAAVTVPENAAAALGLTWRATAAAPYRVM